MSVPFTRDQFFDSLAAYNTTLWPFVLALWIVTVVAVVRLFRKPQSSGRLITMLLAAQWAWAGVVYHAAFFARINPAAPLFAALFVVESGLLVWYGLVRGRLHWSLTRSSAKVVAWTLIVYGILYPVIARAEGHAFPRLPTFGVPCPTTILTIGVLLAADPPMPRLLALVPIAWASLGGQAVFLLGVRTDLMLLASGVVMLVYILGWSSRAKHDVAQSSGFDTSEGKAAFMAAYDAILKQWIAAVEELDIPSRFGSTHVIVSGPKDAPPLVLLHGYGATSTMWTPNMADFSKDHRVYAIDVMGQPSKSIPAEPIRGAADYVTWLTITLDALRIARTPLVGVSFGGWLAGTYAVARPERVEKLVLLSSGGLLPLTTQFTLRGMLMTFVPTRFTVKSCMKWLGITEAPFVRLIYLGLKHFRMPPETARVAPTVFSDDELRTLQVPTLVLYGDHEVICDPAAALARARRLIPNVEGELIAGCRHDMCGTAHAAVDARVLDFLKTPSAAARPAA